MKERWNVLILLLVVTAVSRGGASDLPEANTAAPARVELVQYGGLDSVVRDLREQAGRLWNQVGSLWNYTQANRRYINEMNGRINTLSGQIDSLQRQVKDLTQALQNRSQSAVPSPQRESWWDKLIDFLFGPFLYFLAVLLVIGAIVALLAWYRRRRLSEREEELRERERRLDQILFDLKRRYPDDERLTVLHIEPAA